MLIFLTADIPVLVVASSAIIRQLGTHVLLGKFTIGRSKVFSAILPGVQNPWGECAVTRQTQNGGLCLHPCNIVFSRILTPLLFTNMSAEDSLEYDDFLSWTVSSLKDFLASLDRYA